MKTIAKTLLLVFAFVGIGFWAWGKITGTGPAASEESARIAASPSATGVTVTYFSSDVRCPTCLEIEALTRRAVEERFAEPLANGRIAFQILNMDEKENAHFVDDYELAFKTVVISGDAHAVNTGNDTAAVEPWVKMDEVWTLVDKPDEFIDYLAQEIDRRLPNAG